MFFKNKILDKLNKDNYIIYIRYLKYRYGFKDKFKNNIRLERYFNNNKYFYLLWEGDIFRELSKNEFEYILNYNIENNGLIYGI